MNQSPEPATPRAAEAKGADSLLEVHGLKMYFPLRSGMIPRHQAHAVKAVDGIDLTIARGETLGLVGESGCGKSTAGLAILQLYKPTAGQVVFQGKDLTKLGGEQMRVVRRRMQVIFQDPYASLNPRMLVGDIIAEPLEIHALCANKQARSARVAELLELVGLSPGVVNRYPREFSGGQRQRIGIARALAVEPDFVVCDEPVSALDVSVQAQVINLLQDLQAQLGLTYLFIAHSLSVIKHISNRVAVMYLGKVVEQGRTEDLFERSLHPYTRALLSAVPIPNPAIEKQRQRIILEGEVPSPINPPRGCRFHTRCPIALDRCRVEAPALIDYGGGHIAACWRAHEVASLLPDASKLGLVPNRGRSSPQARSTYQGQGTNREL
jgi:oligopeptide transport system ATP-binding protein